MIGTQFDTVALASLIFYTYLGNSSFDATQPGGKRPDERMEVDSV